MTVTESRPLFVFGTLLDSDVLRIVLGRVVGTAGLRPAVAPGYRVMRVSDETYPVLVPDPGFAAAGALLADLNLTDWDRIRFFESGEYALEPCRVAAGGEYVDAVYCAEDDIEGVAGPWSLPRWRRRHKARFLRMIEPYMALYGRTGAVEAEALWRRLQLQADLKRSA